MKSVLLQLFMVVFLCLYGLPTTVDRSSAHRVNVFAWVEGDTVHVQSKFSGGSKVKAGKIAVMDSKGVNLLSGMTNEQGEFSFKVPRQTDLRIVLSAGEGHQGEWTIRASELVGVSPPSVPVSQPKIAESMETQGSSSEASSIPEEPELDPHLKREELEALIEAVIDRKLKPVTRMLAEIRQDGPSVSDLFAGIGYILGLVGVAVYVQNRKRKD